MSKALHSYYLQQMGIENWIIRKPEVVQTKLWVIGQDFDNNSLARGLFNKMLSSIGLLVEDVCLKSCVSEQLLQELNSCPPRVILALGNDPIRDLLNTNQPLISLRGQVHAVHEVPVVVSYSPIDLLKQPIDKKKSYQDLLFIQQLLSRTE